MAVRLSAQKVGTDGSQLRTLGSDAMASRLLGILRPGSVTANTVNRIENGVDAKQLTMERL
jgi:hypothetical protein